MKFDYKKSLGQNFLKDKNIIKKIADSKAIPTLPQYKAKAASCVPIPLVDTGKWSIILKIGIKIRIFSINIK